MGCLFFTTTGLDLLHFFEKKLARLFLLQIMNKNTCLCLKAGMGEILDTRLMLSEDMERRGRRQIEKKEKKL